MSDLASTRKYYYCQAVEQNHPDSETEEGVADKFEPSSEAEGNLVGSLCGDGYHRPVLDIDWPAQLIPSSTPNHFHLYLDVPMEWKVYEKLLDALAEAGVISKWYAKFSKQRGMTHVRPPWIKKPVIENETEEF